MSEAPPPPGHPSRLFQAFRDQMADKHGDPFCFEDGTRGTPFGLVTKICVGRRDGQPMAWREIWERFAAAYPGCWALQVFPPESRLIDRVNNYHLWMLHDATIGEALCLRGKDRPAVAPQSERRDA